MLSMTGYGRGEYKNGGIELTVEIKTVNNRYLDVSVKCPRIFNAFEDIIRSQIREKLTRGHADVYIGFSDKREKERTVYLDEGAAKAYADAARRIKAMFPDAVDDFSVTNILRFPDVIKTEDVSNADDESLSALKAALSGALEKLNGMRKIEGNYRISGATGACLTRRGLWVLLGGKLYAYYLSGGGTAVLMPAGSAGKQAVIGVRERNYEGLGKKAKFIIGGNNGVGRYT